MTALSRAFLARVFVVVVASQLLLVAWTYKQERDGMEAALLAKVQLASGLFSSAAGKALLEFDVTNVGLLMDQALKDPEFISVQLFDDKRYPVLERMGKGTHLRKFTTPVMRGVDSLGTVEMTYSTEKIERELLGRVLQKVAVMALVMLALTFVIVYFFRVRVAARVDVMGETIRRATAGDLTVHVEDAHRDELHSVAAGINFLIDELRQAIGRIAALSGEVSATVNALLARFDEVSCSMAEQQVSTEEISQAIDNLNRSQTQISRSAASLSESSEENTAAVTQTMTIAQEIARRVELLASGMHQAQATMSSLEATSRGLTGIAGQAERNVDEAVVSAGQMETSLAAINDLIVASAEQSERTTQVVTERGIPAFGEAERSMSRIHSISESLATTIAGLGSGSKDIAKILAAISEVTERTKLLSLNASIIAAQSGEHGKGFMVVAEEMKRLSDQTAQSTREIVDILQGIQRGIGEAVREAHDASSTVQDGRGVIGNAGEALQEILDASRDSTTMVHAIKSAASLQHERLDVITATLAHLRQFSAGVTKAIREDQANVSDFSSSLGELGSAVEASRQATDEQVVTMQHVLENIVSASCRTSDIAVEVSANESEGKVIAVALADVVATTERTTSIMADASQSLVEVASHLEKLSREMERFKTA